MKIKLLVILAVIGAAAMWLSSWIALDHGVVISTPRGSHIEPSFDQIDRIDRNNLHAELTTYVWVHGTQKYSFFLKGLGKRRFYLDDQEVKEYRRQPFLMKPFFIPMGFHKIRITCEPAQFSYTPQIGRSSEFLWVEAVPGNSLYAKPATHRQLVLDLVSQALRILVRCLLITAFLLALAVLIRWSLKKAGMLQPSTDALSRSSILVMFLLFGLILLVRLKGISYQLEEGLHPDEHVVENAAHDFRHTTLKPKQYFWSPGFEYAVALTEQAGYWLFQHDAPPHLVPRLLSALFSWFSCIVLFSIGKRLFNPECGLLAAALLGFSFLPIEIAHQGIVEPSMVLFFLIAFRLLLELKPESGRFAFAMAGFAAGLGVGMKQTAGIILIPFLTQTVLLYKEDKRLRIVPVLCWGLAALAGYLLLSPYTLLDFSGFLKTQLWQIRSQEGHVQTTNFFAENASRFGSVGIIIAYLTDGMGYPLLAAALLGVPLIWRESPGKALLVVPVTVLYFALCCMSRTPPYHYVLLLCPFLALLAAVTVSRIASRPWMRVALAAALLLPSLLLTVRVERIMSGTDTRRLAEIWCNENLPPDSRIDYEVFGPRFLMPFFNDFRVMIFKRPDWTQYLAVRQPEYYVYDSTTAALFEGKDSNFPVEAEWFRSLWKSARMIHHIAGNPFRMYNPDIFIFEIQPHSGKRSKPPADETKLQQQDSE